MINQEQSPRIALVGDSLSGGGAERVHAMLSLFFTSKGITVANCIFSDSISYRYAGSILNLGTVARRSPSMIRKAKRLELLRDFIANGNFDAVIDFRMRTNFTQEFILANIFPDNTYYTIHSAVTEFYFPQPEVYSRLIYRRKNIVSVSKAIRESILSRRIGKTVASIPNPVDLHEIDSLKRGVAPGGKYILAAGRMNDEVKQFGKLIETFAKSPLPESNVNLVIIGEGRFGENYKALAESLNVGKYVEFAGFLKNPYPYYANAMFTVLSSKNEGFPNVLIESLACGTPVVAFDCFSGPSEIIEHLENGVLVEDQNFDALGLAMTEMATNAALREHCTKNSARSVQDYDLEIIGAQWLAMMKINVS